jgi:YceI-like domain
MSSTLFERTPTRLSSLRQLKVVPGTTRGATDQKVPIEGAFCHFLRSHSSAEPRSQSLRATRIVAASLSTLLFLSSFAVAQAPMSVPAFQITREQSTIKFEVDASVAIIGTFDKWDAALTFTSPDAETAVFEVKIRADSVDTGSSIKNNRLKGMDFFDVEHYPLITFQSTKVVQTSPERFELDGKLHDPRSFGPSPGPGRAGRLQQYPTRPGR